METITSRLNPLVRRCRALARARDPQATDVLLDGMHLVEEARAAGAPIEAAVVGSQTGVTGAALERLAVDLAAAGTRVLRATEAVMAAASPVRTPSGIVAIAHQAPAPLDRLLAQHPALVLALAGVQDPGNVGAAIRSAEAGGATGVVVSPGCADPFGWKALRGSMGSALRLPVARLPLEELFDVVPRHHVRIVATQPRGGHPIYDADLTRSTLLLVGSEGAGLPPEVIARADEVVSVPMQPPVESLNLAVTAALLVYEARRQRQLRGSSFERGRPKA